MHQTRNKKKDGSTQPYLVPNLKSGCGTNFNFNIYFILFGLRICLLGLIFHEKVQADAVKHGDKNPDEILVSPIYPDENLVLATSFAGPLISQESDLAFANSDDDINVSYLSTPPLDMPIGKDHRLGYPTRRSSYFRPTGTLKPPKRIPLEYLNTIYEPIGETVSFENSRTYESDFAPALLLSPNNILLAQDSNIIANDVGLNNNNGLDFIEQGSGNGASDWDTGGYEDSVNQKIADESRLYEDPMTRARDMITPTPMANSGLDGMSTPSAIHFGTRNTNRAPVLVRRLPKLIAVAGQAWRYSIHPDTFMDEDGDLSRLKSSLAPKNQLSYQQRGMGANLRSFGQYEHWLQYDSSRQMLYGFPTEIDAGLHEYSLIVVDRFGEKANETIEIHVRQHQSTRAFTHSYVINGIFWGRSKFNYMVDALHEIISRLAGNLFPNQASNLIVHSFTLDYTNQGQPNNPSDRQSLENR